MRNILDIRVQKLFIITIVLKIGSSFLGWRLRDPWILGLAMPLAVMAAYILLGIHRRDKDVTDEKFADTCYYLGFIFTITSIIFSLFDLPNIGTRIQDIAVRFGAAMVSTVFGLVVRVCLVSFKKDFTDAVSEAENAVIDAAQRFREQLNIASEKFFDFQIKVDNAARENVERVNMQIEALSKNHADKLSDFFADLTARNRDAFTQAFDGIGSASLRLSETVDGYTRGMHENLSSIEAGIAAFTGAVADRLRTTTFPDDYFVQHLEAPLAQLKTSAGLVSGSVNLAASEVTASSANLSGVLKTMAAKANDIDGALDTVLRLTAQQQAVLDTARGQQTALEHLGNTLADFGAVMSNTLAGINAGNASTADLTTRVAGVAEEIAGSRERLEAAFAGITDKLDAAALSAGRSNGKIDDQLTALKQLTSTLTAFGRMLSKTLARINTGNTAGPGPKQQAAPMRPVNAETRQPMANAQAEALAAQGADLLRQKHIHPMAPPAPSGSNI